MSLETKTIRYTFENATDAFPGFYYACGPNVVSLTPKGDKLVLSDKVGRRKIVKDKIFTCPKKAVAAYKAAVKETIECIATHCVWPGEGV